MLRVVLDPGVLVSAAISRAGAPAELLDRWRDGLFDLIVSPKLLDELEDVLLRPKFGAFVDAEEVRAFVDAVAQEALLIQDPQEADRITRDPDDDYLFALARAAPADALVSGDRDLIDVKKPPVPVLTPRQLVERLERE